MGIVGGLDAEVRQTVQKAAKKNGAIRMLGKWTSDGQPDGARSMQASRASTDFQHQSLVKTWVAQR